MKLCDPSLVSNAILLSLLSVAHAKKNTGGGSGGSAGDGTDYAKARSRVYHTISFDKSPCVSDPSPAKFGQYGCCPDPGSLPQFSKGWNVEFLERYDSMCIEPIKGQGLELKFKVVPGKGLHDAEFITFLSPFEGTTDQQWGTLTPLCVGTGEEKSYTFSSQELLRRGDVYDAVDSAWEIYLTDLPAEVKDTHGGEKEIKGQWGAYSDRYKKVGGPWLSSDCHALAERIRAGNVSLKDYPNNQFALQALGGKAPGGGTGNGAGGGNGGKGHGAHGHGGKH